MIKEHYELHCWARVLLDPARVPTVGLPAFTPANSGLPVKPQPGRETFGPRKRRGQETRAERGDRAERGNVESAAILLSVRFPKGPLFGELQSHELSPVIACEAREERTGEDPYFGVYPDVVDVVDGHRHRPGPPPPRGCIRCQNVPACGGTQRIEPETPAEGVEVADDHIEGGGRCFAPRHPRRHHPTWGSAVS